MANIVENPLVIERINQLGHLDQLFNVAEERMGSGSVEHMLDVASYGFPYNDHYAVYHPNTQEIAYKALPGILHGFMGLRYRELRRLTAEIQFQDLSYEEVLSRCKLLTKGRLSAVDDVIASWLVQTTGGLHRPVILNASYGTNDEGCIHIEWYMQPVRLQEGMYERLKWRE